MREEDFIDEDVKDISISSTETDLITKLNSPINIVLLALIIICIISIIVVLVCF